MLDARALATDYDGTLAREGKVAPSTLEAIADFRRSGRAAILVTGRRIHDLRQVFAQLSAFDRIVAENGGVLFRPQTGITLPLTGPPDARLLLELRKFGVEPLEVGEVIIATHLPHLPKVERLILSLKLDLMISLNREAVMVLPTGVNKAFGLRHALDELGIPARDTIAIGDAENDLELFGAVGCGVAVANALQSVKRKADFVTSGREGDGVVEVIGRALGFRS